VDEDGKELEKPKAEEKVTKPKKLPKQSEPTSSNNIFKIGDEMDNMPSLTEYPSRESKLKGQQQQEPVKKRQLNKPSRKPLEDKENGEKAKEPVDIKKSGPVKPPKRKDGDNNKKAPHPATRDLPFWQNDLFKPLVYVFAFVTLISVLYLTLN